MTIFKHILALDTAMGGASAGVYGVEGDMCVSEAQAMHKGQAEHLMPIVEQVMREAKIGYEDLSAIVTTIGPGAFTGLRVGLSTAKALGLARDIPVYGITTLQALALQYLQSNELERQLGVIVETRREDFYYQVFTPDGAAVSEPASGFADKILAAGANVFIGDALERFQKATEMPTDIVFDESYELPDPCVMAKAFVQNPESSIFTLNPDPVYLRSPDVSQSKKPQRVLAR